MIRSPLRPEGLQQQQEQRRLWQQHRDLQQQQELQHHKQQQLEQLQQHNEQQLQQQHKQQSVGVFQVEPPAASPAVRRLSAVAASSPISHGGHSEWVASGASHSSAAAANSSSSSSSSSSVGVTIAAIGNEMMQKLKEDCEAAAQGARHRAEEFASFIDAQMAELEELATESARLQAEVEDLHAKTQQNLQEVETLLEEDKAVDAELGRVIAAKKKVELRLESAQRKLQAARSEYAVVSRQEAHARREWRARVDLYKFTHGLRIHQLPGERKNATLIAKMLSSDLSTTGQSAPTRICFLGLYKDLPQLECFLDVSLEADSCKVVGAWPEAPLSELAALYAEGRVSFAGLLAYSRLLFKKQLTRMTHTQKLVSLHEQQRQRAAEENQSKGIHVFQGTEREAFLCDAQSNTSACSCPPDY